MAIKSTDMIAETDIGVKSDVASDLLIKGQRVENVGMAARDSTGVLAPWRYTIREPLPDEVLMRVMYCGICHSDIHMARNEWGITKYPLIPGHEFVGIVERVGSEVTRFAKGDPVGIGFMCDSCLRCESCLDGREQHCESEVDTYGGFTRGENTYGGYGKFVVCRQEFVVRIPDGMDLSSCAPLLCAGITTYSPIRSNNMERGGLKIGVIGLGGLGHMAVQWGAKITSGRVDENARPVEPNEVWVISRSKAKHDLAQQLGAKGTIQVTDSEAIAQHARSFDYLMDTVAVVDKPLHLYFSLLKPRGTMITVGLPAVGKDVHFPVGDLVLKNCSLQGSLIGGIRETQEMIDFAHKYNVVPLVEHISMADVNEANERVLRGDVKFRFVLNVHESHPNVDSTPTV